VPGLVSVVRPRALDVQVARRLNVVQDCAVRATDVRVTRTLCRPSLPKRGRSSGLVCDRCTVVARLDNEHENELPICSGFFSKASEGLEPSTPRVLMIAARAPRAIRHGSRQHRGCRMSNELTASRNDPRLTLLFDPASGFQQQLQLTPRPGLRPCCTATTAVTSAAARETTRLLDPERGKLDVRCGCRACASRRSPACASGSCRARTAM
jgi:hypothetical protein